MRSMLAIFLLAMLFAENCSAKSSGADGCDYRSIKVGAQTYDPSDFTDDGHLNKECIGCIMPWVEDPTPAAFYVWRTDDGPDPSKDPKEYIPSSTMPLYLYTTELDKKFAGIHLHAVETTAPFASVGSWEIPDTDAYPYHLVKGCDGHALTHSSSDNKLLRSVFFFKTPPAGTGEIKFETLIKQGYQGTGAFYWPKVTLELKESAISTIPAVVAEAGEACSEVCARDGRTCVTSSTDLITRTQTCALTMALECDDEAGPGVSLDPNDGGFMCYVRDPSCDQVASAQLVSPQSQCEGMTASRRLVCHCPSLSGSPTTRPSGYFWLALALLATVGAGSLPGRFYSHVLAVACLSLLFLQPASAHNWINTPGRYQGLANNKGIPRRAPDQSPQVQVNDGQLFQVEWTVGHSNRAHYFVLMEVSKESFPSISDLELYLQEAPAEAVLKTGYKEDWRKVHIGKKLGRCKGVVGGQVNFINRHSSMRKMLKNPLLGDIQQDYGADQLLIDKRAEYTNPKLPSFISVHKFHNFCNRGKDFGSANFRVPAGSKSGNYVMFYIWEGFEDIIDIRVHDRADRIIAMEERYGLSGGDITKLTRADHCEFTAVRQAATQCRIAVKHQETGEHDASRCLADCKAASSQCNAIAVVRANNPIDAGSGFPVANYTPNIPVTRYNEDVPECNHNTVHQRAEAGCTSPDMLCDVQGLGAGPDDYICYGLTPYFIDTGVTLDHITTTDPMDPKFYSTCFKTETKPGFHPLGLTVKTVAIPPQPQPWHMGNRCLECSSFKGPSCPTTVIDWTKALLSEGRCIDCDYMSNDVDCEGSWSEWSRCSTSCVSSRSFTVTLSPSEGGMACPSSPQTKPCQNVACECASEGSDPYDEGNGGKCCGGGLKPVTEPRPQNLRSYCAPSSPNHGISCWSVIVICRQDSSDSSDGSCPQNPYL